MTPATEGYVWSAARFGHDYPVTLDETLTAVDRQVGLSATSSLAPMPVGFVPLDEILGGGLRPGDLMVIGGGYGVGKTIFALQVARNAVASDPNTWALYICYEHEPSHLMSRLICMETSLAGMKQDALTLRKVEAMLFQDSSVALTERLRQSPRYARVIDAIQEYAQRLVFIRAGGSTGTVARIREWTADVLSRGATRVLVVVDYVQKIPTSGTGFEDETERTIQVIQDLKELAMSTGVRAVGIAAMTQEGLKAKRMRLADMRGGTALQYEADVGLVLHNKRNIVSREHLVYNAMQADEMRRWIVMSIEKNRSGAGAVDLEFALEAAHFCIVPQGAYVRDRLVDGRVVLE